MITNFKLLLQNCPYTMHVACVLGRQRESRWHAIQPFIASWGHRPGKRSPFPPQSVETYATAKHFQIGLDPERFAWNSAHTLCAHFATHRAFLWLRNSRNETELCERASVPVCLWKTGTQMWSKFTCLLSVRKQAMNPSSVRPSSLN